MPCDGCGAVNASNAPTCGACGRALEPAPAAPDPLGVLALRFSAVATGAVAVWLLDLGYGLALEEKDDRFAFLSLPLFALFLGLPAIYLAVAAGGTWALRTWGVGLTLCACALVGLAGFAIAIQGSREVGLPLLVGAGLVGAPLLLPAARAAHR